MSTAIKDGYPGLVIFDCDGTLVDSQYRIHNAMQAAFLAVDRAPPPHKATRSIIGLSLEQAIAHLLQGAKDKDHQKAANAFRDAYQASHASHENSVEPFFDGIAELIDQLLSQDYLIAVATGNSQRGLDRILTAHGIKDKFISLQTADFHPSKPHPSMTNTCLADAGAQASQAVVIGDTSYDMMMARSAGTFALGVSWGYHDDQSLRDAGAHHIVDDTVALKTHIDALLRKSA